MRAVLRLIPCVLFALWGCSTTSPSCEERITWAPGSPQVELGENDQLLICGDPSYRAWRKIPPNQASNFLRNFLEANGYLEPKISINYETDHLTVDAGPRSVVRKITVEPPLPPLWKVAPLETNIGKPLTKATLDRIQGDTNTLLMMKGYPCAKAKLTATVEGDVHIELNPGPPLPFTETTDLSDFPLERGILTRYEPFQPGDRFDVNALTLAGRRIEADGVATRSTYTARCTGPEENPTLNIERVLALGPRRLWEFGIGASTEEYPIALLRWKNTRLWSSASRFESALYASNVHQKLTLDLRWYYDNDNPRLYWEPLFLVERRTERRYQTVQTAAALKYGKIIDVGEWTLTPEAIVDFRRLNVIGDPTQGDAIESRVDTFAMPGFALEAHSNDYERYANDPRAGIATNLKYDFLSQGLGSTASAHRVLLSGTGLLNWKQYMEPTWILAVRFTLGTIFIADGSTPSPQNIPPDWFFLLGGDQNLRGYGRNTLPRESVGAGTMAYAGFESRWPSMLSLPLEPLVFFDIAKLGQGNAGLINPLFLSPGFGFRWGTPIGTLRTTLARGIALTDPSERRWQFFLSLGTEF